MCVCCRVDGTPRAGLQGGVRYNVGVPSSTRAALMDRVLAILYALVVLVFVALIFIRRGGRSKNEDGPDDETVRFFAQRLEISLTDSKRMLREVESSKASVIVDKLLLGNAACAADGAALRAARVGYILNATSSLPNHFEGTSNIQYLRVPVEDSLDQDLLAHLDHAVRWLQRALSDPYDPRTVLVHCQQGVSRSATIVLAYLMRERGLSLSDSIAHVERRRFIRPNEAFIAQLAEYEARGADKRTDRGTDPG